MANLDLDRLLDFCVRFAQNRLVKSGAFYPFAANVQADGTVTPLAIHTGNEHPEARQMIEQLTTLLTTLAREKGIRAAAVCYDGLIAAGGEARRMPSPSASSIATANAPRSIFPTPWNQAADTPTIR